MRLTKCTNHAYLIRAWQPISPSTKIANLKEKRQQGRPG